MLFLYIDFKFNLFFSNARSKEEYNFIATPIIEAGARFISVEYDLAPTGSAYS